MDTEPIVFSLGIFLRQCSQLKDEYSILDYLPRFDLWQRLKCIIKLGDVAINAINILNAFFVRSSIPFYLTYNTWIIVFSALTLSVVAYSMIVSPPSANNSHSIRGKNGSM